MDKLVLIHNADYYKGKEKMHAPRVMSKQDQANSSDMK